MKTTEERKLELDKFIEHDLAKVKQDRLKEAMRYAIFPGGKRLRPQLCIAASETEEDSILPVAASIEYIHTYSLIHDDLPSMDNDDTRRGKASVHKKFGDAIAILTGDSFLTDAFRLITETKADSGKINYMINTIARAAGSSGMAAGQADDIMPKADGDERKLLSIAEQKTGKLIRASVLIGAIFSGKSKKEMELFDRYAQAAGLAYQLSDDIQDIDEDKINYASFSGEEKTVKLIYDLMGKARDYLTRLKIQTGFLTEFCTIIEKRSQI